MHCEPRAHSGWIGNREIVTQVEWWRRPEKPDNAAAQSLIRRAYDFAVPWMEQAPLASAKRKLEIIERDAAWLFDVAANDAQFLLANGPGVDLMPEQGNGAREIMRRFVDLVVEQAVRRLIIVFPLLGRRF